MTDLAGDAPAELVPLERRVLVLWRIRGALATALPVVASAVLTGLVGGPIVGLVVLVGLTVAVAALLWWWTGLVWRSWRFAVGNGVLELRHGVLTRRESTIPFHRVQHIDTEAGPLERRLGLTTFVLRTASASSDSTVPGIDAGHAEELRLRILALVGTGDAL